MIWTQQAIEHYIRNTKAQYNVYLSCQDGVALDLASRYIQALEELAKYVPSVPKFGVNDRVSFIDVYNYDGSILIMAGDYIILEIGTLYTIQDEDGGCKVVAQDTVETFGERI